MDVLDSLVASTASSGNPPAVAVVPPATVGSDKRSRVSWETAALRVEQGAAAAPVSRLAAAAERVSMAMERTIRLGGWTGWHRNEWESVLKDAALTAGVGLQMEALEDHWWRGTTYRLVVSGPRAAVERYQDWFARQTSAWLRSR
ncbi:MAG: hypothetical protein HY903_16705 [Deltaproteobacteria bacterium]|nr:hypothetical protein [Deltaproteobacteria bacterium]